MFVTRIVRSNWRELTALSLLGLVSFLLMKDVNLLGDERFYSRAAIALADYVRNDINTAEFDNTFFSRGWFMPGMSIVLSPIAFLDPGATESLLFFRAWMTLVNLFLVWLIMLELQARSDSRLSSWLFLVTFISPYALLYTSTLWADLTASLLAIYIALKSFSVKQWTIKSSIVLGIGLASMIYLRGQYLFLLPVYLFLILMKFARANAIPTRDTAYVACAILLSILLLLPWSVAVSKHSGIRTLTTTLLKESQIMAFGDRAYRQELISEGASQNRWFAVDNTVRQKAQHNNVSVGKQYEIEHANAFEKVTRDQLLGHVSESIRFYLFEPSLFPARFATASCRLNGALCGDKNRPGQHWLKFNTAISFLTVSLLALFMLTPIKAIKHPLPGVFVKGIIFLYMVHPLFAFGHPRYLAQFAPVLALAVCLLAERKRSLPALIGFESLSFYGLLANAGQFLAASIVFIYIWLLLFY